MKINGSPLEFRTPLMRESQIKTKNMQQCQGRPLKVGQHLCVYYHQISSICLLLSEDDSGWSISGNCGVHFRQRKFNSSDLTSEVDFYGYPLEV
jgi:hypothetical protein